MIDIALTQLGLTDKEILVYKACLRLGPSPVRRLSDETEINRGTTYDILKNLVEAGLVSYYHKSKRQYFIAEDPEKLRELVDKKEQKLKEARGRIEAIIPELKSMHDNAGEKPVVKFFEGHAGVKTILKDVIESTKVSVEKLYHVYSTAIITNVIYKLYPNFTKDRIKNKITVKVISLGPGGETRGLDERKWLEEVESSPTYTIIYDRKTAMITVDSEGVPLGVIIEDRNIFETQKMLFDFMWRKL